MKDLNDQVMRRLDHLDEKATRLVYELDRLFCLENWNFEELERILLPLCEQYSGEERERGCEFSSVSSSANSGNGFDGSIPALDESVTGPEKGAEDFGTGGMIVRQAPGASMKGSEKEKSWWQRLTGHKKTVKEAEIPFIGQGKEGAEEKAAPKDAEAVHFEVEFSIKAAQNEAYYGTALKLRLKGLESANMTYTISWEKTDLRISVQKEELGGILKNVK